MSKRREIRKGRDTLSVLSNSMACFPRFRSKHVSLSVSCCFFYSVSHHRVVSSGILYASWSHQEAQDCISTAFLAIYHELYGISPIDMMLRARLTHHPGLISAAMCCANTNGTITRNKLAFCSFRKKKRSFL